MPATAPSPFASKSVAAGSGNVEKPPAGNKPARLIALIDLGSTTEPVKQDDGSIVSKVFRKYAFFWELVTTKDGSGRPFIIGERYRWSDRMTGKAAGRQMIESWRGEKYSDDNADIDPVELVDTPCLVNVVHKTNGNKVYVNVDSITPMFEGMAVPERSRDPLLFHLSMGDLPDTSWLPYLYGESVADILGKCNERNGASAVVSQAAKSPIPPAPEADPSVRAEILEKIEAMAAQGLAYPEKHPVRGAIEDEVQRLMEDNGLIHEHLGDQGKTLVCPF